MTDIEGREILLGDLLDGKKCYLIVNVASKCMLSSIQYQELVKAHQEYRQYGFEILAFPCNQFLSREPGSNEQIVSYARGKHGAEFPIFSKVNVNGQNAHEVFKYVRSKCSKFNKTKGKLTYIPYNFSKFLLNSNGEVVVYQDPTKPVKDIYPLIEELCGIGGTHKV